MIKEISEIPMNTSEKMRSYRQNVRNDIKEAVEKRIKYFEFEGEYNYKYLAQYAREEGERYFYNEIYCPAEERMKAENDKRPLCRRRWEYKAESEETE